MGHFSEQYIDDCDRRTSDDDHFDRVDGVSSKPALFSQPAYTKTITPAFEIKGKRKKLTGYIGELREGDQLIFSQEYSTNHEAEIALDALAFDLLSDNPQATAEPASTCCFCHKPHHPQDCPDMRGMLFAPDTCMGECEEYAISAPLDVDFAPVAWEV